MDHRHGLVVDGCVTQASGTAEREAADAMIELIKTTAEPTLAADMGYDTQAFFAHLGCARVKPHIAQNTTNRRSAVPDAFARSEGSRRARTHARRSKASSAGSSASAGSRK